MYKMVLIVSVLVVSLAGNLYAACMSCNNGNGSEMVCSGASTFEVKQKCGQPDDAQTRDDMKGMGGRDSVWIETNQIDTYYYNCGSGRFTKILTFKNGKLQSIANGDKGSGPEKCW